MKAKTVINGTLDVHAGIKDGIHVLRAVYDDVQVSTEKKQQPGKGQVH